MPAVEDIEKAGSITSENPSYDGESEEETTKFRRTMDLALKVVLLLGALAFTIAAFVINSEKAVTLIWFWLFFLFVLAVRVAPKFIAPQLESVSNVFGTISEKVSNSKPIAAGIALATIGIIALIIGLSIDSADRLVSALGIFVFVLFTWAVSWKPRDVKWRPVLGGLLLQFIFGVLIMRTDVGFNVFTFLGDQASALLNYTNKGSDFVFGYLINGQGAWNATQNDGSVKVFEMGMVFAAGVLPTVIFFSALVSILYHLGILQAIIEVIGRTLAAALGTSASESLSAAGNIFVGQTEAPLLVRPFLPEMTESEIHAVMTGGFATIAGGVMAAYISYGVSASHLLSASVMSAPAALAISKLAYPETEESKTRVGVAYQIDLPKHVNVVEAAATGAEIATKLAINIAGQLIAFLALLGMIDAWLAYFGLYIDTELSFAIISGWVFYPVAWLLGADTENLSQVATLIGYKIFANEFVAYLKLAALIKTKQMTQRSIIVATYALCGFSNFGSIGIQIGGLSPLAENKRSTIAKLVFSAMVAGNVACFLTACIAGLLYDTNRA